MPGSAASARAACCVHSRRGFPHQIELLGRAYVVETAHRKVMRGVTHGLGLIVGFGTNRDEGVDECIEIFQCFTLGRFDEQTLRDQERKVSRGCMESIIEE